MKIVTRTALSYAILTAGILFVFAYVLYYVSEKNREDEFNDRLGYKIIWRSEFIFDAKIDNTKIKELHLRNKKILNEADISVYNDKKELLFTDILPSSKNQKYLDQLIKSKKNRITWLRRDRQYMAIKYEFDGINYYIIGSAVDVTGRAHVAEFKKDIIIIYFISIIIIFIIGFMFSYYTLKPLKDIIIQIRDISEHNLHKRLVIPKAKDEIYELTETFNSTFNRLEKSFNNHKQFVTTISHEFRTPLSTLIAELELAKELNTTLDDFKISVDNALQDANHASQLSSALLDFARASYDISQISFSDLRLDEVLADAKVALLQKNSKYRVGIHYMDNMADQDESNYDFHGNPYLLQIAFLNLMENACKYSEDQQCRVEIEIQNENIEIRFIDNGIGISEADQVKIFDLFYRGNNKSYNSGNGIGLSIVTRIIEIHQGVLEVESKLLQGSVFKVKLPTVTY
ncbi:HAMP domain-containing sensor histidine kinase [Chryseobacterium balustinum]|uniref:histidine kinase n=1 Tax=Chryseobacterium balustinum TaxID=246 RepID=A0AAX2IMC8_9FLAO|nr:HAMP domain-containing sensor histidine kinase [Chryseobacterium balustinum]AZB29388.1 sensor histidine kinase [Chryseobacterium balustinum]SKC02361.1 Signal transduction histidine kinase [Chryseobacterium balustinum]SQA90678.1 Signal transduction histidine-protein kinase ArlS [Chryseobacterium balustinum]